MTLRRVLVFLSLVCAWVLATPAAERYLSINDIRPGMIGIGRTVFQGNSIDEFRVHILGVLRSTIGPRRDLILARLEGGPLAKTGVIAGMSGSPVYVDGRMIGAVSYSLGSFSTEPIAGITPIAEMIEAGRLTDPRPPGRPVIVPSRVTLDTWREVTRILTHSGNAFERQDWDLRTLAPAALDPRNAAALRPIATPLVIAGLSLDAASPLVETLGPAGFVATPASGRAQLQAGSIPAPALRPGDPVGVALLSGDYTIGATGTVTEVDGERVYAFGHPLYGLGSIQMPMTRVIIHTILPSLMSSTKLASTGEIVGTFSQDRSTVLAGTLGSGPDTIPFTIRLANERGTQRDVSVSMIDNPFFTPLLGLVAVGGALSTFERDMGINTYAVRGTVGIRGHDPVLIDDIFTGDQSAFGVASSVAVPLAALLTNNREPIHVDSVSMEIRAVERERVLAIERVWVDAVEIRPGRTVPLKILLRPTRGTDEVHTVQVPIPLNVDGPLTVIVSDGVRLAQLEQRDGQTPVAASSLAQLVSQLNRVRRNNQLYVRVYRKDGGAMVGGEPLPALPDSVLAVIETDRSNSGTSAITNAVVGSWDLPVDYVVAGMRTLTMTAIRPGGHP